MDLNAKKTDALWKAFRAHFAYSAEEVEKIKEHCLKYGGETLEIVQNTAKEVSERTFLFRLAWDMEQTVEPVHFEGEIDWKYCLNEDEEFVFQLNRHRFWICLGQAYAMSKDEKYAKAFADQITSWIRENPLDADSPSLTWRTIEAGLRCDYWVRAMAFFTESPHITDALKERFFLALDLHADYLYRNSRIGFSIKSNWGVLEYTGLYLLSLVLGKKEEKQRAVQMLKLTLQTQVHEDGMQWESSPMYHHEVLAAYLEVLRVAKLYKEVVFTRKEREQIRKMAYAGIRRSDPKFHQIQIGDSDDTDIRDLVTQAALEFRDPVLGSIAYRQLDFEGAWLYQSRGIAEFEKIPKKKPRAGLWVSEESGDCGWRSSFDEDASLLYFRNAPLGGGHGHLDKLHLELWIAGEKILCDSGRFTYRDTSKRRLLKHSVSHNVPLLGNAEYTLCKDSWEYDSLYPSMPLFVRQKEKLILMEGYHCGYIYQGKLLRRRILILPDDIYVIHDEVLGNTEKNSLNLTTNFHFAEKIQLMKDEKGLRGKGADCEFVMQAFCNHQMANIELSKSLISAHYNQLSEREAATVNAGRSSALTTVLVKTNRNEGVVNNSDPGEENDSERRVGKSSRFDDEIFMNERVEISLKEVYNFSYNHPLCVEDAVGFFISRGKEEYAIVFLRDEAGNRRDLNGIGGVYGLGKTMVAPMHKKPECMTVLEW